VKYRRTVLGSSPSWAAIRFFGRPSPRSRRTSRTSIMVTSRYIHASWLRSAARSRRPLSRGQAKGGKGCEKLAPQAGKVLKNLTPEGGKVLKKSSGKGPYVLRTDKIVDADGNLRSVSVREGADGAATFGVPIKLGTLPGRGRQSLPKTSLVQIGQLFRISRHVGGDRRRRLGRTREGKC
jgi:hypothetical protein